MAHGQPQQVEIDIIIPNNTKYLEMIGRIGEGVAMSLKTYAGDKRDLAYHIDLILTEAVANAICHGNHRDPDKQVRIHLTASDHELVIKVYDQGQGFNLNSQSHRQSQDGDESGRGINLIFRLMDEVDYYRDGEHNILHIVKHLH